VRIGIVTPAYNVAPWIGDAIASVLAQSHPDWTLTIVDDGSTDTTAEVAARFPDPRIRLIRQPNAGVAAARNAGIAQAGGDALLFLDADDWLTPDALSRLVATLAAAPGAIAATAPFRAVPESTTPGSGLPTPPTLPESGLSTLSALPGTGFPDYPNPGSDPLPLLLERNLFANGGHLLIRREAVERAGGFREGIAYGEDWEYWVRLALLGRFATAPGRAPVLFVRQRASGAYLRMATDQNSFRPCMDAIFANPALVARFGAARLAAIRRRAEAENRWIIGRELVRHGRRREGRAWLRRSVREKPSLKRALLLAAAHALPLLPRKLHGPFRAYPTG
jgi:glycosyltransferase involved in cell wall biosynthesis